MKMSPKGIHDHFNQLAQDGGATVVYTQAEWRETGLWSEYGDLPKGYMALCVFNSAADAGKRVLHIDGMKEDRAGLHVQVSATSGNGHPHLVKFVPETRKPVTFEYAGATPPKAAT